MFMEKFKSRLLNQDKQGLFRAPPCISGKQGKYIIIDNEKILNFSSNDYLGLSVCETLKNKVSRNFRNFSTSSSSSRLVSGNYSTISQAEKAYADYFGYEDAVFFPSGYQANLGVISTLFEHGDILLFDKHIHASSVKGMKLSGASIKGYNHNSLDHLEKRLKGNNPSTAVLTETLFSMDGDLLDIGAFSKLKKKYGFFSVIDEAHAFGVLGEKGRGLAGPVADIAVGTFGKALGLFGAFVLLPETIKEYLFNFSSPLIYTTTLPEAHAASAMDLLEIIHKSEDLRLRLKDASTLMKSKLETEGFNIKGEAHILALEIGDEKMCRNISRGLLKKGIFVLPARFPTVPLGKAILMIGMTALHDKEDVDFFITNLKDIMEYAGKEK